MRIFFSFPGPGAAVARLVLLSVFLAGCAMQPVAPPPPVDPEALLPMPRAMSEFVVDPARDDVIGELQVVRAHHEDTLSDIARRFNVGWEEIVAANPGVDHWVPKEGTEVIVPTQWVLPDVPRKGIVVNLAAMRLFYFPVAKKGEPQRVITYPVGIGRVEWKTPMGRTRVVARAEAPAWIPTPAIRREHAANGDPLPRVVPPGPDNPMGTHVLRLGWPEYAIHGTNKPASIGLRGTHGCLRMYPEDIVSIYEQVPVGTPVTVIDEPNLFGFRDDVLHLQAYPVLEDDRRNHQPRTEALLKRAHAVYRRRNGGRGDLAINHAMVGEILQQPRALTLPVSLPDTSAVQLLAQAPRVKNRLPVGANWDGAGDISMATQSGDVATAGNSSRNTQSGGTGSGSGKNGHPTAY